MPIAEPAPLPAIVALEITKDLVRLVPSIEIPMPAILLMLHGPTMNGFDWVPAPLVTHPQVVKSASLLIVIGACDPAATKGSREASKSPVLGMSYTGYSPTRFYHT